MCDQNVLEVVAVFYSVINYKLKFCLFDLHVNKNEYFKIAGVNGLGCISQSIVSEDDRRDHWWQLFYNLLGLSMLSGNAAQVIYTSYLEIQSSFRFIPLKKRCVKSPEIEAC